MTKLIWSFLAFSSLSTARELQENAFGGAFVDGPSLFYSNGTVIHNADIPNIFPDGNAIGPDESCKPFAYPILDASESCQHYAKSAQDVINKASNETVLKYFKRSDPKFRQHISKMYNQVVKECSKPAGEVTLTYQHQWCERRALFALDGNKETGDTKAIYCPSYWAFFDEQYRQKYLCEGRGKRQSMTHGALMVAHVSWTKPVGAQFKFEGSYIADELGAMGDFAYNEAHYCYDIEPSSGQA